MADERPSERDINVESTVNVGTANDGSSVGGAKVSVGSAREVHVHGDTTSPPSFRSVALVGVLAFLGAVLVNIATSHLPPGLQPYLWLAWPLTLLVTAASIWAAYRQGQSGGKGAAFSGSLERRSRRRLLDKVEAFWIKGVLEQSLYQAARIELGLEHDPDAIAHPWKSVIQRPNQQNQQIPPEKAIIEVFDELGGELLILGAPGAGKTTLLLELARDLITRARNDEQYPIPVVFNLSSWFTRPQLSKEKLPDGVNEQYPIPAVFSLSPWFTRPRFLKQKFSDELMEWLVDELKDKYGVPGKLARTWMEKEVVLPLLDGLDEADARHRNDCVKAINTFRQNHGLVPLTVCSRVEDYKALTTHLQLQCAIVVQPLTRQQVVDFFERVGANLMGVQTALSQDADLAEMLDSPLMLSIVSFAYAGKAAVDVEIAGPPGERRRHLFDVYTQAMFKRRSKETRYTEVQTRHCLAWLAHEMATHNWIDFYARRIELAWLLAWLPQRQQRQFYMAVDFFIGLFMVLGFGLIVILGGGRLLLALLAAYLIFSLIAVEFLVQLLSQGIRSNELWTRMVPKQSIRLLIRDWLRSVLLIALSGWLFLVLADWLLRALSSGLLVILGGFFLRALGGILLVLLVVMPILVGMNAIQHAILRWILYRNHLLPLRLVPFLDYCAERIFLRKVGGGYIFVHRLLMEHFASLYSEGKPAEPVEAQRTPP